LLALASLLPGPVAGAGDGTAITQERIAAAVAAVETQVIEWRRDLHRYPELGNREHRTAGIVADHLRSLGLDEVRTGVAHTGVVGVLRGGRPGPVVALRADMDALPVTEQVDLPFASKVRTEYNGRQVGVMHACGHDVHTSVLMGAASVLASMRGDLPGTVLFLFQPAEEGPPAGEEGGATLMIAEGAIDDPVPEAIFGLHTWPIPAGTLGYRAEGTMAGAELMRIEVRGRQTHGAVPWGGIDPIVVAAQIVLGLQTVTSRQVSATSPVVVSVGSIHGGNRSNIIPDVVEMEGTVRMLDPAIRDDVLARIERSVVNIAVSAGATAVVEFEQQALVTYNDPALTRRMAPSLQRVVGAENVRELQPITAAEDFSYFQQRMPGLYFFLGINDPGVEIGEAAMNHSPLFRVNEDALPVGVRAMVTLAVDYLSDPSGTTR
jgi:amidohydrolase